MLNTWRIGRDIQERITKCTLDWLVNEYYQNRKYTDLASSTQKFYRENLQLVLDLELRNASKYNRVGQIPISQITPGVADKIYDRLTELGDAELTDQGMMH